MMAETFGEHDVGLLAFSFQIGEDLCQVFQEFIRIFCIFGGIPGFDERRNLHGYGSQ